jgi:Ser/Thr protein kinase RdoA (MazF antagonist)
MDLEVQIEMFEQVLDELADDADLVNQVIEITLEDGEELHILRYRLPVESG